MNKVDMQLISSEELELIKGLSDRELQVLSVKLISNELSLLAIARSLFPDIDDGTLKYTLYHSGLNRVYQLCKDNPTLTGQILSIKLFPLAILTLNKLIVDPETRSNVKATAAKEMIRLGESSMNKLAALTKQDTKANLDNLLTE